jgi:hypothetical protein
LNNSATVTNPVICSHHPSGARFAPEPPELLNDAVFGAIYYRMLLRSAPLTKRFGEELVEQVILGHRSGNARG